MWSRSTFPGIVSTCFYQILKWSIYRQFWTRPPCIACSKQHKPNQRKVYGGTCFQFRTLSKTGEYMKLWEHVWTCRSVWWQRWSIISWCRIWKAGKAWKSRSFCNWESKYNRYCIRHFLNRRKHRAFSTNRDYPWNGSGIQTLWTTRAVWEPGEWLPNLMVCSSNYLSVIHSTHSKGSWISVIKQKLPIKNQILQYLAIEQLVPSWLYIFDWLKIGHFANSYTFYHILYIVFSLGSKTEAPSFVVAMHHNSFTLDVRRDIFTSSKN